MADTQDTVSPRRLYLGNLPPNATKADIESHFGSQAGKITEVKLMSGFGFIEYEDSMDARDIVPAFHGTEFMGNRLVVQFARGGRPKELMYEQRVPPRTRRTQYRMSITGLAPDTSWQDLKDFARVDGLDVVYSEVTRERDGRGFVEYETAADLKNAAEKLDGQEFKGATIRCLEDVQSERPRDRFRSRSPPPMRRGYGPPGGYDEYYDRRGPPPRGYSPRGYRERSPPPPPRRDYMDPRDRYPRSPPPAPRGRPPMDDYPPPRRPYPDDPYPPPPSRGYGRPSSSYADDPYMNGYRGGYDRPASPPSRRPRSPPPRGWDGGYERRGYW